MDALGNGYHAVALFLIDALHLGQELVHIEVHLREVHQVRPRAVGRSQCSRASQPASVTAHNFNDAHHAGIIDPGVLIDFHAAGGNILGGGSEAGAVVGAEEVVVDGLGHAHHAALIANLLHILGNFVAGIHRVVAAVVEEVAHVVLFEDLQDTLVVGVIHIGVLHLIAAGAQCGGGGILQKLQLGGVFLAHVEKPVIQHALDAMLRAQNPGDVGVLQRRTDDAISAGVDDRGGTAGLTKDARAFQFTHIKIAS